MFPAPTSLGSAPSYSYLQSNCDQRKIEITWQDFAPNSPSSEAAVADLSASSSGESLQPTYMVLNGGPITLELPDPTTDQSYLLQIKHSQFVFDPIIIQFTSDCNYNYLSINYAGYSQNVGESILDVDLALVDWGPRSQSDPSSWIAELSFKKNESGIYLYDGSPIQEETIFVDGSGCSSQPFTIGRASNGRLQEATFSLHLAGPSCPQSGTD